MTRRILFHVQHLLGVGHVQRTAALARAFDAAGWRVKILLGGRPVTGIDFGGAETVQLPPAHAADAAFSAILDADERPIDAAWEDVRRAQAVAAASELQPDVFITEHYPFGRRRFRFELNAMFDSLPSETLVACSVRDILIREEGKPDKTAWMVSEVQKRYDTVLVHGDATIVPFAETFDGADAIADRLHHTGYVVQGRAPERKTAQPAHQSPDAPPGEVIVSIGGGAVGGALLDAALDARLGGTLSDRPWRFLIGRNFDPSAFSTLTARAAKATDVTIEWARPDFRNLLAAASLSISQAGYNTLMDILMTQVPAVVVPFEHGQESEQRHRAEAFARHGILSVLPENGLTAKRLGELASQAAAGGRAISAPAVRLDGAEASVRIIEDLLAARRPKNQ